MITKQSIRPNSGVPIRFSVRSNPDERSESGLGQVTGLLQPRIHERPEAFDLIDVCAVIRNEFRRDRRSACCRRRMVRIIREGSFGNGV